MLSIGDKGCVMFLGKKKELQALSEVVCSRFLLRVNTYKYVYVFSLHPHQVWIK